MTPERWQQVKGLLAAVLETDPSERSAYLDRACTADRSLRDEIENLLAVDQGADAEFLNTPAIAVTSENSGARSRIGRRIGPYQLVEEIGVGGMGEVYRAFRADDQYRKQVAIKFVRAGQDSKFVIGRFKNERQVLASLDHPNIARLLDGGTTEEGVPYFVMELIAGQPINEYCDSHQLPTTERLKLFLQVCSAVQYAHQRLIIHRDLKPSNILVTPEGMPKLLDFGIAKILNPSAASEMPEPTVSMFRLLTPGYASPEQVRGETVTTASDVYSLGVLLYELLTGHHPYRVVGCAPHEIAQAVCEFEPEKPSTVLWRSNAHATANGPTGLTAASVSAARDGSPEKLSKRLRGDLDNVILMALRKEPERRYASVEQLATDIRRHLENLPVSASKATLRYRASKFMRRQKGGVAAATAITITLLVGLGATLYEVHVAHANQLRAEQRFKDVRELANSLMFDVHDSIKDLAGATPARKLLVTKALQYLEKLSQESAGDASLQRELATAYEKIGDVQGNPLVANLGDTAGALASYRKALALREAAASASGASEEAQKNLASDYERIGLELEDGKAALEYYRKDLLIQQHLAEAEPGPQSQERLASAYFLIAQCYAGLQDPKTALENYQKSAALREAIAGQSSIVQTRLAGTYGYMAPILWYLGDHARASVLQRRALDIMKKLFDSSPTNATYREYVDEGYYWTGFYLEEDGDFSQALLNYRRALADFQALASADPREVRVKRYVAICYKSIGTALVRRGNPGRGLQSILKSLLLVETLPRPQYSDEVASTYDALGLAYSRLAARPGISRPVRLANWKQARAAYQTSLDIWLDVQSRGGLSFFGRNEPESVRSDLAKCDSALQKLGSPPQNLNVRPGILR